MIGDTRSKLYDIRDEELIYQDFGGAEIEPKAYDKFPDIDLELFADCLCEHNFEWDMAIADYLVETGEG